MKAFIWMLIIAMLIPQAGVAAGYSAITGVWRGEMDNLPVFVLTISDEGKELTGAILFYMIRRDNDGSNPKASPGIPEPLFNMKFDGKVLEFQVSHRRAHPPRTKNDPPVTMHFDPAAPGGPRVYGGGAPDFPNLKIVRVE